ncbi:MAG: hypothetical protein HQ557_11120 [Bacteroidetes bacterium]|nr:hypothetical protein [Bacteroidota bacterium]
MKALLILNRGSRSGKGQRLWGTWLQELKSAGIETKAAVTETMNDASVLAEGSGGYDLVIAAGGDGTINRVIDGVMRSGTKRPKLGILYSGTSPDFCTFHGIPTNPEAALQVIIKGKARKVDVTKIIHADENGIKRISHFGCGANIGMGAIVARRANRWRKRLGDTPGTWAAVVSAIIENPRVDIDLILDGETYSLHNVNNLFVLKSPFIASGLRLNFPLSPTDGKLVVAAIHGKGRMGLLKTLPAMYSGNATDSSGLFTKECRIVEISSPAIQELEYDGDPRGWLPARIEIIPKALDLIGSVK